jgi:hypothetical protein
MVRGETQATVTALVAWILGAEFEMSGVRDEWNHRDDDRSDVPHLLVLELVSE